MLPRRAATLAALLAVPVVAGAGDSVDRLLEKGDRALAKGNVRTARAAFAGVLEANPGSCAGLLGLARAESLGEDWQEAIDRAREAQHGCDEETRGRALGVEAQARIARWRESAVSSLDSAPDSQAEIFLRAADVARTIDESVPLATAAGALQVATELAGDVEPSLWLLRAELAALRRDWDETVFAFDGFAAVLPREARAHALSDCVDYLRARDPRTTIHGAGDPAFDRRPRKTAGANPSLTREARAARLSGWAVAEGIVTRHGDVRCIRLLKDLPLGQGKAMVDTLRTWRFEPGTVAGEPVDSWFMLTTRFGSISLQD